MYILSIRRISKIGEEGIVCIFLEYNLPYQRTDWDNHLKKKKYRFYFSHIQPVTVIPIEELISRGPRVES